MAYYTTLQVFRDGILANACLLILSVAFYFLSTGPQGALLIVAIIANWFIANRLRKPFLLKDRGWLIIGIAANLSLLGWYKYYCFVFTGISQILPSFTIFQGSCVNQELPVGISFFTFMAISYLVEVYRKNVQPSSLLNFGTYLSLFPHLVAGPIVRYSELVDELKTREHSVPIFFSGMLQFSFGFAKKVLIADSVGKVADNIFSLPINEIGMQAAWIGALCYTIQIFFDFSGYTDMAIGLAKMFGFHFPPNFDQPYRATSITEFWRRWHMTLSRWFRDYLYIPLGGNRHSRLRTYANLSAVFLLCGLWHGAAWTFIVWGAYHGILLVIERMAKDSFGYSPKGSTGWFYSFILIVIGWVIFRSPTITYAGKYLSAMFIPSEVFDYGNQDMSASSLFFLVVGFLISITSTEWFKVADRVKLSYRVMFSGSFSMLLLLIATAYLTSSSYKPFIYFRF